MPFSTIATASQDESIWKGLGETTFRENIVALGKASKSLPAPPRSYVVTDWERRHPQHPIDQRRLSLHHEQRIADDLAYIAACKKSGKIISAVALEEHISSQGMTVRLAANGSVPEHVVTQLKNFFSILASRAKKGVKECSERSCVISLFEAVVKLDRERIRGRLRSEHRGVTRRKTLLHQHLLALVPLLRQSVATKEHGDRLELLSHSYKKASGSFKNETGAIQLLQEAVKCSHDLCTFMATGTSQTWSSIRLDDKRRETVEKIGRYYGLCVFLSKMTRLYPALFSDLILEVLRPYKPTRTKTSIQISPDQPSVYCYVHAEIQLIVFYDTYSSRDSQSPRTLGVCKSACFLCNLFISLHDTYLISHTHGRLYDQWTVPDLKEYKPTQRDQYRSIIKVIYQKCTGTLWVLPPNVPQCPAESKCDLREAPSSIAATTAASNSSQTTIEGPTTVGEDEPGTAKLDARASTSMQEILSQSGNDAPGKDIPSSQASDQDYTPRDSPKTERELLESCVQSFTKTSTDEHSISNHSLGLQAQNESVVSPLQYQVNHLDPLYIPLEGIHLDVEADGPTEGKLTFGMLPDPAKQDARTVDVDALAPGQDVVLRRDIGISILHINLLRSGHQPTGIRIEWLPS